MGGWNDEGSRKCQAPGEDLCCFSLMFALSELYRDTSLFKAAQHITIEKKYVK